MCGLGGYINLSERSLIPDRSLLEHMQQQLAHRGPNGYRIWVDEQRGAGFFHRRLSIMDLSDAGFQPMMDKEESVVVMCNGEIYNHPELRKELEALGYHYVSNSDTETIIHAYKEWGIDALKKLNGMFSIVILDKRSNEFFLVRDRLGIKPLYFSLQGDMLSFASEIKALWPLPWIEKELNTQAMYHYLTYLITPAPMTLYKGIYKLPASYYLKIDSQKNYSFHEWYCPLTPEITYDSKSLQNEQFCSTTLQKMLRESVKQQMMSDVPYGVFLSGGIDSSLNVALMSEFTPQVKTFNVSFDDGPEYSEINWARKIARRFNTDHHEIIISEKEAFEFYEKMVFHQDEPLADCVCIPLYYVSKLLSDAGVVVVQVGEGSDELFCGYSTYATYLDYYNRYWKPSQKFIPAFAKQTAYQILSTLFPHKQNRLDMIKNWADGKSFFWSGATAFSETWKKEMVHLASTLPEHDAIVEKIYPGFQQLYNSYVVVDYHLKQLKLHKKDADFLTSMIYLELKHRLPELLLMRVDKMTMATSVEARVPFLDHRIVEFALQLPASLKYKNGITKYILKKACEGILPADTIYRKKMGFAAPTSRWFKQGNYFKPYFLDLLHSKNTPWNNYLDMKAVSNLFELNQKPEVEYSVQLWALQNLIANQVV
jgi:asparagine synthase (glutamine-hydrolysing)